MYEVFTHNDEQLWYKEIHKPKKDQNYTKNILSKRGYTACVDFPTTTQYANLNVSAIYVQIFFPIYGAIFIMQIVNMHSYKEILKENTNAKVILTIRDTPEKWYESTINTIYDISIEMTKLGSRLLTMWT